MHWPLDDQYFLRNLTTKHCNFPLSQWKGLLWSSQKTIEVISPRVHSRPWLNRIWSLTYLHPEPPSIGVRQLNHAGRLLITGRKVCSSGRLYLGLAHGTSGIEAMEPNQAIWWRPPVTFRPVRLQCRWLIERTGWCSGLPLLTPWQSDLVTAFSCRVSKLFSVKWY